MKKYKLKFKHKKTLQHLILLLLGILLLIVGVIGYLWTQETLFFYIITLGNILIIYVLIASKIKKNEVVYDAVFLKCRLNDHLVYKMKIDEIKGASLENSQLTVFLTEERREMIDLKNYKEEDQQEFYELVQQIAAMNS